MSINIWLIPVEGWAKEWQNTKEEKYCLILKVILEDISDKGYQENCLGRWGALQKERFKVDTGAEQGIVKISLIWMLFHSDCVQKLFCNEDTSRLSIFSSALISLESMMKTNMKYYLL